MTYSDWMLIGIICAALVLWAIKTARSEPRESFDTDLSDDKRVGEVLDELDRQEMKTHKVRCIS